MKVIINNLKKFDFKLWTILFLSLFLPTIYQTVRIYLLGNLPSDQGINIASQISWLSIIFEILQEALILPLFFLIGKSIYNKIELENKVKTGLITIIGIYSFISITIFLLSEDLVNLMSVNQSLQSNVIDYIKLESLGIVFMIIYKFLLLIFTILSKAKNLFILLIIQLFFTVLFDILFLSNFQYSIKLGVNGIAFSNIITYLLLIITALSSLKKQGVNIISKSKLTFIWLKDWFRIGKLSGLESLIRNFVFMVMIIKMINEIEEQGNYWIANNFIWGFLLLPSLALSELVKKEVAEDINNIRKKTFSYLIIGAILSLFWLISIPIWKPYLVNIMNVENYETVYYIVIIQTFFYLVFIFNNCILDSTFYGIGRTDYLLYQSLIINIIYYGILYILYLNDLFIPSLKSISLMFGFGIVIDLIPTIFLYMKMLKRYKLRIDID